MTEPPSNGARRCGEVDRLLAELTPGEAVSRMAADLIERGEYRALLDARLLAARLELGLPPVAPSSLSDLPEPERTRYEERYVAAIREVAGRLIDSGDILGAWPYLRAIGEPDALAQALDGYQPVEGDERLSAVIDLALHQGVRPRKGFELVLCNYGPCAAISSYELLPQDETVRAQCAEALIDVLHEQLRGNLVADLVRRGQPEPAESETIRQIVTSRPWLFEDEAYHIDVSHLAAVVRHSLISKRRESLEKALDLCAYGSRLSSRLQYEGDPPFERTYDDHALYLRALVGDRVEESIEHFRAKLKSAEGDEERRLLTAVALVRLNSRLDRLPEAIEIHARNLQGSFAGVPSLESLCERAERPDLLVEHSRRLDDPVRYAAAVLAARGSVRAST